MRSKNNKSVIDNKRYKNVDKAVCRAIFRSIRVAAFLIPLLTVSVTVGARAATLVVTKVEDTNNGFCAVGGCSLREAIAAAAPGDEIVFASPLFDTPQIILLTPDGMGGLGGFVIDKDLTIVGPGADRLMVGRPPPPDHLDANRMRIFDLGQNQSGITLIGMTISGGVTVVSGGGIQSGSAGGSLTLIGCHVTDNWAFSSGGGIRNNSPLTLINSTISNNDTGGGGGGIYTTDDLHIINSTISGNSAGDGGGIYCFGGNSDIVNSTIADNLTPFAGGASGIVTYATRTVTLSNSIISGNRNNETVPDLAGPSPGGSFPEFTSLGYNLIGNAATVAMFDQPGDRTGVLDPLLAPLALNRGSTPNHALLTGSPAIDKGKSFGYTIDQRGIARPYDDVDIMPAPDGDNSDIGAFEINVSKIFDFDGDGRADLAAYRPSESIWYRANSSNGSFAGIRWGLPSDKLVPADYDGDGKTDHAVFRDGTWWIIRSSDSQINAVVFGQPGDLPRPMDVDADGKSDICVFRSLGGTWYCRTSLSGDIGVQFGQDGDVPMLGDHDGDGKADFTVFRPATGVWYVLQSSDGQTKTDAFGRIGDIPLNGDFTGDRRSDLAVFRPTTGVWYIARTSGVPAQNFEAVPFGLSSDTPVAADYDGDGKTDIAVYRSGQWWMLQSGGGQVSSSTFGLGSEKPVESVYSP
jgi:CSLREA domain-containing protein